MEVTVSIAAIIWSVFMIFIATDWLFLRIAWHRSSRISTDSGSQPGPQRYPDLAKALRETGKCLSGVTWTERRDVETPEDVLAHTRNLLVAAAIVIEGISAPSFAELTGHGPVPGRSESSPASRG